MPPQACLTALVRSCGKRPHSPSKRDGDAEIVGLRENSTSFPLYPSKPSAIAASLSVTRFARQAKHPKSSARTHTHGYTRTHNTNYSECACRASKWQVHCVCGDQHMGSVGVWTSRAKFSTSESWRVLALLLAWCKRRYRRPLLLFSLPFLSAVPHCSCKDACK